MLKSLYIKKYALIDSLEIDFGQGFSVITGETGAGKSIILGALSLILGHRADVKLIKQGENKCIIEGCFDITDYNLQAYFEEHDIDFDSECRLRRELLISGKSRAFINDSPVTLNDLKDLGSMLIDIHSQHQNLLLGNSRFQMQIVDVLADNQKLLDQYQVAFKGFAKAKAILEDLKESIQKSKNEEDFYRFQYETLKNAALFEGEQEELEAERDVLSHSEDIKSVLYKIYTLLSGDEYGVVSSLKEGLQAAQSLSSIYSRIEEIGERLETSYIDMKDLSSEVERLAGDIEFNPDRLLFVQSRLDTIYTLQKKHNVSTVEELIHLYTELTLKIDNISQSEDQLIAAEKDLAAKMDKMFALASKLTDSRKKITNKIEKELTDRVAYLGMPNIRIKLEVNNLSQPNNYGQDNVVFLFSANKNVPLQPVSEIASGGEISRLMLCLKSMLAGASSLPTIIFDEIDTGVSGEIADKMGLIMKDMSNRMQVIAISHLPQIAAKGNTHYLVYKDDDDKTTTTHLRRLNDDERLKEIARMLSGSVLTDAAIENAKVMLGY